ncbi:C40 family peptidase [Amycolatopsis kentuckyensis]|uniref:C40 family peptidase n=1 Tax=Amycolatopsis kentuckyensis TaxID=218823 RepID=UPI001302B3E3|nr:NlpC/P60 family protein [Amycolatopsis kentuckyensis]
MKRSVAALLSTVLVLLTGVAAPASAEPVDYGKVADLAFEQYQRGKPYLWGGEGPDAFDSPGLVKWCYAQFGVRLPRTSANQFTVSRSIAKEDRRKGDLVFLGKSEVGIVYDGGDMVMAIGDPVGKVALTAITENATIRTLRP